MTLGNLMLMAKRDEEAIVLLNVGILFLSLLNSVPNSNIFEYYLASSSWRRNDGPRASFPLCYSIRSSWRCLCNRSQPHYGHQIIWKGIGESESIFSFALASMLYLKLCLDCLFAKHWCRYVGEEAGNSPLHANYSERVTRPRGLRKI